jgi:putative oxidoreductase
VRQTHTDSIKVKPMKTCFKSYLIRVPFAGVFLYHGLGKLIVPGPSADMLGLSVFLVVVVGIAEILAGIGALVGGWPRLDKAALVDRLTGLAAAPVMLGAIAMVHWPRWSFVPTEEFPLGGMEFQVLLLGLSLYWLLGGRLQAQAHTDANAS